MLCNRDNLSVVEQIYFKKLIETEIRFSRLPEMGAVGRVVDEGGPKGAKVQL